MVFAKCVIEDAVYDSVDAMGFQNVVRCPWESVEYPNSSFLERDCTLVKELDDGGGILINSIIGHLLAEPHEGVEGERRATRLDLSQRGPRDPKPPGELLLREGHVPTGSGDASTEQKGAIDNGHNFLDRQC